MQGRMESPSRSGVPRSGAPLLDRLRRALESLDLDAFAELFAEGAVLEEVSSLSPPSHPTVVQGREAIGKRLRRDALEDPISGWTRQLQRCLVEDALETPEGLAFTEVRIYAAGDRVIAQHLCRTSEGRIDKDRMVVVWDAD